MTTRGEWLALAERCEKATKVDNGIDRALADAAGKVRKNGALSFYSPYTSSIDAAASLMPDDWAVTVETWPVNFVRVNARKCNKRADADGYWHGSRDPQVNAESTGEALARCAAACRVRAQVASQ